MVFNGEIYNHLDLRADLAETDWRGHSDTETLLAGITQWGLDESLRRAAGMFALALWDRRDRTLSLARDRIGEKPLYWGWAGRAIVFGSELKALRAHPDFPHGICRGALAQYLRFAYVPAPRSIHPGIYKMEPGSILEIDGPPPTKAPSDPLRPDQTMGSLSIRLYWSLNAVVEAGARDPIRDEDAAVAGLEGVLGRAVQRQMLADVPLGAFLSGGVDSSAIVALMQAHSTRAVKTFTIGFEDAAFDESPHAAAVAAHLGTDHTMMRVTDADARAVIPDLPQLYDEPFADSSQIPTHLICRAARAQVAVALSGDAGDELFGGYNRYIRGPRLFQRLSALPAPLRAGLGAAMRAVPAHILDNIGQLGSVGRKGSSKISDIGSKVHRLAGQVKYATGHDSFFLGLVSQWPDPPVPHGGVEPASILADPLPTEGAEHPAARMMVQDMRSYLPDDILCKVDRAAMGVSLETRVPFLDPDVIDFAARLPMEMKIRGMTGKWALRQVLYRHVPQALIDRPKAGFAIPIGAWLRGPLRDWAETLLSYDCLAQDGLLDVQAIRKVWALHLSGRSDESTRLWTILMFQAWRAAQR
jgi:asparagine synthase (glutamine-hydrolysing)